MFPCIKKIYVSPATEYKKIQKCQSPYTVLYKAMFCKTGSKSLYLHCTKTEVFH